MARDAKFNSLREDAPAIVYQPFRQARNVDWMYFEVRTARDPKSIIPDVRRAVASVDRSVPLFAVKTQAEQIDGLLLQERLFVKLSASSDRWHCYWRA